MKDDTTPRWTTADRHGYSRTRHNNRDYRASQQGSWDDYWTVELKNPGGWSVIGYLNAEPLRTLDEAAELVSGWDPYSYAKPKSVR